MSLALIAVVLVLLVGHAAPSLGALRRFDWLLAWRAYLASVATPGGALAGRLGLALAIGLPVLLAGTIQLGLRGLLWGVPSFLFALLMLFWCWGPRELDADVDAVVEAESDADRGAAIASLTAAPTPMDAHGLVDAVFAGALRRWFGPLLWFLLLGPAGVLCFRILARIGTDPAHAESVPGQTEDARWLLALVEWPAAQLMTFALALAANFDAVFTAWRGWHAQGMRLDTGFLFAAARASVEIEVAAADTDLSDDVAAAATPESVALRDAMSLIWRMLLLWLGLVGMFVIARLLG